MKHKAKKWKYVPEKHICVVDRKDGIGGYIVTAFELRHENLFMHMQKTKAQISCAVTAKLISDFVFAS